MTDEQMIREEQDILDDLISKMDHKMLELDKGLTKAKLNAEKAKDIIDAYGALIAARDDEIRIQQQQKELYQSRNELYSRRLVLKCVDQLDGQEESLDLKVGLHTYESGSNIYIVSWTRPVCRHYILDNASVEYDGVVTKDNEKYVTHYTLLRKRQVEMFFDQVEKVTQLYPLNEETKEIIADSFLQELLNRRGEKEFKNIVFSIQKKQGEIIQIPFKQNLIVQGCAGSGKSMIMLHRLPILLFDNPNDLENNNIYIITPSETYIEMADNLRLDLEIQDLSMGTLNQYYKYVLVEQYGLENKRLQRSISAAKYTGEEKTYIYTTSFVTKLRHLMKTEIDKGLTDSGHLEIFVNSYDEEAETPLKERLNAALQVVQDEFNTITNQSNAFWTQLKNLCKAYDDLAQSLRVRRTLVEQGMRRRIEFLQNEIADKSSEINEMSEEPERHERAISTREEQIANDQDEIKHIQKKIVALDTDGFYKNLKEYADEINKVTQLYNPGEKPSMQDDKGNEPAEEKKEVNAEKDYYEKIYSLYQQKEDIYDFGQLIIESLPSLKHLDDDQYAGKMDLRVLNAKQASEDFYNNVILNGTDVADYARYETFHSAVKYYVSLSKNIIRKTYLTVMKDEYGMEQEKGIDPITDGSLFILLQITYLYHGSLPGQRAVLLAIDEAQNVAPVEYDLMQKVNGGRVIFNLYGDVLQHIENTKGIDDWAEVPDYEKFSVNELNENYRNARQITLFCNKKFHTEMQAINLDGAGVHVAESEDQFTEVVEQMLLSPRKSGLTSFIVKDRKEADYILEHFPDHTKHINDMTIGGEIQRGMWNIMTIEQVKGLEFQSVIAVSNRMTPNERYVAYTRALDELIVYEGILSLKESNSAEDQPQEEPNKSDKSSITRKRVRRKRMRSSSSSADQKKKVIAFFKAQGCQVKDTSNSDGVLWVIGTPDQIGDVVEKASEEFGISGTYMKGKDIKMQIGWCTKI